MLASTAAASPTADAPSPLNLLLNITHFTPFISHHWLSVHPLNPQAAGGPAFSSASWLPSRLARLLLQDLQAFKSMQYILPQAWKHSGFC